MKRVACLMMADEAPDREYVAGWNAYVRGDDLVGEESKDFLEGYNKAFREYQGRTMRNLEEVTQEDLG